MKHYTKKAKTNGHAGNTGMLEVFWQPNGILFDGCVPTACGLEIIGVAMRHGVNVIFA